MKALVVLALLFFVAEVHASSIVARVTVRSESDIVELHKLGLIMEDAKVRERIGPDGSMRYNVRHCSENGFVTIVADEHQLDLLKAKGLSVASIHVYSKPVNPERTTKLDTIPYQFGWPRMIFNGNSLYENSPTIADIDKNGQLDVSVTNAWGSYPNNPPYLITWRRNGAYLSGFPVALEPGQIQSSADGGISAAGDIFGDDKLELVCGDENGFLYAYSSAGVTLTGFPKNYGTLTGVYVPALADIDGDGKAEIAVISHDWDSPYGNAQLHVLKVIATGPTELPGFPITLERGAENSPAIGDLDGNGSREIVVCTGGSSSGPTSKIIAYTSTGQVMSGFPYVVGANSVGNSPTLFDIDNDGKLEILIRMKPDNNVNGIYAINYLGQLVSGFPFPITYGHVNACVAVGDMTGDGIPELAYGGVEAVDSGKVWVYNLSGSLLPGFPARVYRTWVDGSVAIADVDGDRIGDVVCGTNGVSSSPGLICAFNNLGQPVRGFPIMPGNPILNSFETHPTLVDIDGDGDTEIFAGRLDKYVYAWDTPGKFDSTKVWTTFKGNAARTGGQLVAGGTVPVPESSHPFDVRLDQNYPNPFNPTTNIRFAVGGSGLVRLKVYDLLGREVATIIDGFKDAGSYTVTWNAGSLPTGTYFCRMQTAEGSLTTRMMLLR